MNKKQAAFATVGAALTIIALLRLTEGVTLAGFTGSISAFALAYVWRTKPAPPAPAADEETEKGEDPPTEAKEPEVIEPRTAIALPEKTLTFDEKIGSIIDRCLDNADTTAKLTVKIPLTKEVMYRGEKIKVEGDLTMETSYTNLNQNKQPQKPGKITQREIDD